jgi:hypothetical protein
MSAVRGLKKNEMIYFEKVVYLEKINGIFGMRVSVTELLRHVCSSWIKKKWNEMRVSISRLCCESLLRKNDVRKYINGMHDVRNNFFWENDFLMRVSISQLCCESLSTPVSDMSAVRA